MTNSDSSALRQFGFWLGEWALTWGEDGKGTNTITAVLDGRVIQEAFDGTPAIALKGLSLSVYNSVLGKWQQTWVDNSGGYLDFVGEFADGKMILSREATIQGKPVKQRMVWYNITENALDWNWERSNDGGNSWQVVWQIHYQRKNS